MNGTGLHYIRNQKVASALLWHELGPIFGVANTSVKNWQTQWLTVAKDSLVFSVVREPYAMVASAAGDPHKAEEPRLRFVESVFGDNASQCHSPEEAHEFRNFLRTIAEGRASSAVSFHAFPRTVDHVKLRPNATLRRLAET